MKLIAVVAPPSIYQFSSIGDCDRTSSTNFYCPGYILYLDKISLLSISSAELFWYEMFYM